MRKDLLILALFLLGGPFVAYNWFSKHPVSIRSIRGSTAESSLPGATNTSQASSLPRAKRAPRPHATRTLKGVPPSGGESVAVPSPSPSTEPVPAGCCDAPDLPFPTSDVLLQGAPQSEIIAKYGPPEIHVTGINRAGVSQRFYYIDRKRDVITIADIENGRLRSAETRAIGLFPLPKLRDK